MYASRTERHRHVCRREKPRLSNGPVIELPSFRHRCCRQRCRRQFAKALGAKLVLVGLTELGFGSELNARLFIPPLPFRRRKPRVPSLAICRSWFDFVTRKSKEARLYRKFMPINLWDLTGENSRWRIRANSIVRECNAMRFRRFGRKRKRASRSSS